MRIAVSGTHAAGKSTLVDDFLARHGRYIHEPEPYEWLVELHGEELSAAPTADDFRRQLEVSAERWCSHPPGANVIGERCPLDFLAYVLALGDLGRERRTEALVASMLAPAAAGMAHVDLLAVLPLEGTVAEDEDPELADAMNERLLELVSADPYDLLSGTRTIELRGRPQARLAALERAITA